MTANQTPGERAELDLLVAEAQREQTAGRLASAAAAYRQILARWPDLAEIYNRLGRLLQKQGELDEAATQFERAVALRPDFVHAHVALGRIFQEQGKLDQALRRFERAIALQPDVAEGHYTVGNVLRKLHKLDAARAAYERAIALNPGHYQAHNSLGCVFQEQDKLDDAVASLKRALALRPDFAEAHATLGYVLLGQRKLDEAVASFKRALVLRPEAAEGRNTLGNALKDQGKLEEAAAQFQYAIALKPDYAEAHNNLGNIHLMQGQPAEAAACYERAIALNPDYADAHNNLGNALKALGKIEQALGSFARALALKPDFAGAHYNRTDLKTFHAGDPDLAAIEALAADAGRLSPRDRTSFHFAFGKALEDVGDYPRAFEQLLLGNALNRREIRYDEAACQKNFELVVERFNSELLDRFQGVGDPSPLPVFIVGMPSSGSTLIEQILASHPQVHAAGELPNLDRVVRSIADSAGRPIPFPQSISTFSAGSLRRLGRAYRASLPAVAAGKIRVTDKMPRNFLNVGWIRLILPNARIIHTMRDPVDNCVSCFARLFTFDQSFSYDLAELGRYYRWYHELMAHWRSVLPPGAMLDVSYEDVVDDLEPQARRLIDYCGLPWDDRCLSFHETSRPITTASSAQVRRPLYRSSIARWQRYEAYLQPLLAELASCR